MRLFLMSFPSNYIEIINNVIILFGLGFLYAASNLSLDVKNRLTRFLSGVFIGLFTIFIMLNPWTINEGLFFDVRSIILSVSAYFFGFVPAIVALGIGIAYRAFLGGSGVYTGIFSMVVSVGIGLSWKKTNRYFKIKPLILEYYVFGLVIQIIVWLSLLLIPYPQSLISMKETFVPFIFLFPLVSLLLLLVINNQKERIDTTNELKQQQILLKSMIDSPEHMEIFAIDEKFQYLTFNQFHQKSMFQYYKINIKVSDNYLLCINNETMKKRIEETLIRVLKGEHIINVIEIETTKDKFYEETYTPITNKGHVTGITVISREVTARKNHEASILYLSYYDYLTGLGNRRLYQQKINELSDEASFPAVIIMGDINGLKLMNDAFGHEAGDELLVTAARLMKKYFDSHGEVCRIGGDEFVIIMPNMEEDLVAHLIDSITKELLQTKVQGVNVSISFGFSIAKDQTQINNAIKIAEEKMYAHKLSSMAATRNALVKTLQITLYEKNPSEEAHCKRVAILTKKIGERLHLDSEQMNYLEVISYLHDIGKIAVDEDILNKKTTTLSKQDIEKVKKHPEIGYRLLSTVPEYYEVASDILSHHENYDGSGYPRGLKEEQIPLRARILSIADFYDTLTHRKNEIEGAHDYAINEIIKNKNIMFDPKLVDLFVESFSSQSINIAVSE